MSMGMPFRKQTSMYMRSTRAMPDTMAEKRNTIDITGVDHHGFAFTEPKMKPTYPCRRKAEGMPTIVMKRPSDEAGRERVKDDEDAPLELDLVRVHETLNRVEKPFFHSLPHRPVEAVVIDLRPGRELRLQDLDLVIPQEIVDRVFRVLEVDELPRARGAALAAGRREALRDAVVAQVALVDRFRARVDEPAPVRAGLHAVAAAEAVGFVHEDGAVGALERGAHGAHLRAG